MRALVLALGGLWLSACSDGGLQAPVVVPVEQVSPPPAPVLPQPRAPVEASIRLVDAENARSVSATRSVELELILKGVNGVGQVDVEFIAPGAMPYEKRSTTVRARPDETRTLRFSLPIAGTTIASSGMSGEWEARFFVDGVPVASAAFTLDP